jgi:hypothetical protein
LEAFGVLQQRDPAPIYPLELAGLWSDAGFINDFNGDEPEGAQVRPGKAFAKERKKTWLK